MAINKNAATEDQVGYLHSALTRLFTAKLDALLKIVNDDPEAAAFAVQGKDLMAIAKWVSDNGISATPADLKEINAISDRIKTLKAASAGKVIQFVKEA